MSHQYKFSVKGMSCDGCRSAVEKALSQIEGVTSVDVNLKEHSATIEANQEIALQIFEEAMAKTHYDLLPYRAPLADNQRRYAVDGMTCQGCRSHVEKALKNVDGVHEVAVHLENKEAIITSDNEIPFEHLKAALSGTNYHIFPLGEELLSGATEKKK